MQRSQSQRETELLGKAAQLMPGGSNGNTIHMNVVIERGEGSRYGTSAATSMSTTPWGPGPCSSATLIRRSSRRCASA